eukprot:scaffold16903_cov133-Isochrysis_galbana.AAC.8
MKRTEHQPSRGRQTPQAQPAYAPHVPACACTRERLSHSRDSLPASLDTESAHEGWLTPPAAPSRPASEPRPPQPRPLRSA